LGVYYRDSTMTDWAPYNTGLPLVRVYDLEMNCTNQNLYAATYGRGLWKTNCGCTVITSSDEINNETSVLIYPNPITETSTLQVQSTLTGKMTVSFYDMVGQLVYSEESESRNIVIDRKKFNSGMFFYRIEMEGKVVSAGKFVVD